jgi:hypothetical protein
MATDVESASSKKLSTALVFLEDAEAAPALLLLESRGRLELLSS